MPKPVNSTQTQHLENTTINKKANARNALFSKPPVKLNFTDASTTVNTPLIKKKKIFSELENHQNENNNNISSSLSKYVKFENCTYNSCVFNISNCECKNDSDQ